MPTGEAPALRGNSFALVVTRGDLHTIGQTMTPPEP